MNLVVITGNLTRDPELKYIKNKTAVCNFTIANNIYLGGDKNQKTIFLDITVFGKIAENVNKHLIKGSKVLVKGRIDINEWEKDGRSHRKPVIVADMVEFLTKKDPF